MNSNQTGSVRPSGGARVRRPSSGFGLAFALVLLLGLAGCGSGTRDTSVPSKAFLGHWQVGNMSNPQSSLYDLFVSPDTVTMLAMGGRIELSPYQVVSEDKEKRVLTIKYTETKIGPDTLAITFDAEFKNATITMGATTEPAVWYDAKQAP